MRALAIAVCGLALAASAAFAQSMNAWTHPGGKLKFEYPARWPVDTPNSGDPEILYIITGTANEECHFYVIDRPAWADRTPETMRRSLTNNPITTENWTQLASATATVFRGNVAVQNTSTDTSGFWPIQRATIQSGNKTVLSAVQLRPGLELRTFCLTYDGSDRSAVFNRIIASVGTQRDAEWRTAIEQAQQAAPPQPQTPPPQEEKQKGRRRN